MATCYKNCFDFLYYFYLKATSSVSGAGFGASLGIFTLGMLFPWANSIVERKLISFKNSYI